MVATSTQNQPQKKERIPNTPLRFLWYVSKPVWKTAVITILFATLAQVLSAVLPYILKLLVDALSAAKTTEQLLEALSHWGILYVIMLTIVFLGWRASGLFGITWLGYSKAYSFKKLYDYVVRHSHTYFSNRFAGSIASKIGHASDGTDNLTEQFTWTYYPALLSFTGTSILLFITDARLSAVFVSLIVILLIINIVLVKRRRPLTVAYAESYSLLRGMGVDLITNIAAVRQFGRRMFEEQRLMHYINDRTRKDIARDVSQEFGLLINNVFVIGAILLMMYVLYIGAREGVISAGDVVLVITLIWNTSFQLIWIGNMLNGFIRVYSEIDEGLRETLIGHDIVDAPNAKGLEVSKGEIVWDNVHFGYEGNSVFKDFNLLIKQGERIGLVGSSGAGKTTFVSLLLRLHELDGGSISIDGQNIAEVMQESLRDSIAVVPQEPLLFHRSIYENIAYGRPEAQLPEIIEVAKKAQAHEFIHTLPKQYETLVGERGIKLSGGQKQRVAIARAMLKNAPILVLDEATSALDSESEVAIQKALHELMKGKTVIAIAHRLSTLREMDRIIVLENGRIVEDGTHTTLIAEEGIYARLWKHQAGGFLQE